MSFLSPFPSPLSLSLQDPALEYHFVIRRVNFEPFVGKWMDLENIMLHDMYQTHKLNHHVVSAI